MKIALLSSSMIAVLSTLAVAQSSNPRPTFEVASLKPVSDFVPTAADWASLGSLQDMQDVGPLGFLPIHGNTLRLDKWTLRSLIASAYRVRPQEIVGPDSISDLRFVVDARIPEHTSVDRVCDMLQTLLEERFALRVHVGTRDVPGYALQVAKDGPKLKVAAPVNRDRMDPSEKAAQRMEDLRAEMNSGGVRPITSANLKNVRLTKLADVVAGYLQCPVEDLTGLTERYDIDLIVPQPEAPEDTMEYRVRVALAKFGLKLESHKVAVKALMADSINTTPIPN